MKKSVFFLVTIIFTLTISISPYPLIPATCDSIDSIDNLSSQHISATVIPRDKEGDEVHIILPAFFRAAWFPIALVFIFLLVVFLLVRFRARRMRKERRKLETLLDERTSQLISDKEKAEAGIRVRSEFMANMSHEIRTPLNWIIGMTDLTLESSMTDDQRNNLELVKYSANELLIIVNDILDFSKIESGHLELENVDFSLPVRIKEVIHLLSTHAHKKNIHLKFYIEPGIPQVYIGDPIRLNQILLNLLGNAVKFTEHGEVLLTVAGARHPIEKAAAQHPIEKNTAADYVSLEFSVSDTGIGLNEDQKEIIFNAFSQAESSTTRKYGGTGLGLSISRHLVETMGGHLAVESPSNVLFPGFRALQSQQQLLSDKASSPEGGPGALFHFSIPLKAAPQATEKFKLPDVDHLKGVPVLLIGNSPEDLQVLETHFLQWGMQPYPVDNETDALQIIKAAQEKGNPFKLAVIEKKFPGFDGFLFAKQVNIRYAGDAPQFFVLAKTGEPGDGNRCKEAAISDFLVRPFESFTLLQAVQKVFVQSGKCLEDKQERRNHSLLEEPSKLNCIVAEDNRVNQKLIRRMLTRMGHQVAVVDDGVQLVAKIKENPWAYDLILMDIQMPEMGGVEATQEIRSFEIQQPDLASARTPGLASARTPGHHIPIIALTAHAMKGDRERFLEAGMDAYVSKPIKLKELISAIDCISPIIEKRKGRGAAPIVGP